MLRDVPAMTLREPRREPTHTVHPQTVPPFENLPPRRAGELEAEWLNRTCGLATGVMEPARLVESATPKYPTCWASDLLEQYDRSVAEATTPEERHAARRAFNVAYGAKVVQWYRMK
jgi:hypothetical protein